MRNARKITNLLLDMVAEGSLDLQTLATACLKYMSEDEVHDMARCNEFIDDEPDENDIRAIENWQTYCATEGLPADEEEALTRAVILPPESRSSFH